MEPADSNASADWGSTSEDVHHVGNRRLRLALDAAQAGVWELDPRTGRFEASERALALHGLPPGTPMTHERALAAVHPEDRPRIEAAVRRALATGDPFRMEHRVLHPDGSVHWVASSASVQPDGDAVCLIGLVQDISDRKQAEAEQHADHERLRLGLAHAPVVVFEQDRELRYTWVDKLLPGFSYEDLVGKSDREVLPPDVAEPLVAVKQHVLESGQPAQVEIRARGWDEGGVGYYDLFVEPMRDTGGHVTGIICCAIDVTQRRALEQLHGELIGLVGDERDALTTDNARLYEEVRSLAEAWRALAENASDIISRFDRDLRHLYVNPAIESATGLPASTVLGKTNRELGMPPPLLEYWEVALGGVFERGRERTIEFTFPTPLGERHFQARITPEFGSDGAVQTVLVIARDVTEQQQANLAREELYRELLERDRRTHDLLGRVLLDHESHLRRAEQAAKLEPLTSRERDVLRLLVAGSTNQQIGQQLGLSTGTVRNYVAQLCEKLHAPNRTAAAIRAVLLGIAEPSEA